MKITYETELIPKVEDIINLYNCSNFFPIKDKENTKRIKRMHENSNVVISAWDKDKLVGLARSISDFCYCCYLSELCVRNEYKGLGIGRELVNLTKEKAGDECKLILQSSEAAMDFYKKIGMKKIDSAFIIQREY